MIVGFVLIIAGAIVGGVGSALWAKANIERKK